MKLDGFNGLIYFCNTKPDFRGATCSAMIKSLTAGSLELLQKTDKGSH